MRSSDSRRLAPRLVRQRSRTATMGALFSAILFSVSLAWSMPLVRFGSARLDATRVVATVRLSGFFGDGARSRLESGQPIETRVRFYLFGGREWWPDEELAVRTVRLSARYDAVTQEYRFERSIGGGTVEKKTFRSRDELEAAFQLLENLPIFDLDPAWKGRRVFVRVRASLGQSYVLGIIPAEEWTDKESSPRFVIP